MVPKAADHDLPTAQINLGAMYAKAKACRRTMTRQAFVVSEGCRSGDVGAQSNLGVMHTLRPGRAAGLW